MGGPPTSLGHTFAEGAVLSDRKKCGQCWTDGCVQQPQPAERGDDRQPFIYHIRYRQKHADYVRCVAADRAAAGPFEAFLANGGRTEAKRILDFWCDAQVEQYCSMQVFVNSFIPSCSLFFIYLSGRTRITDELWESACQGECDSSSVACSF